MLSWWNSYQSLSTIGIALKFAGAIIAVLILVLGLRESSLRGKAQTEEKASVAARIALAEHATKPRRLSSSQTDILISSLKDLPQKPKIFIMAGILDAEAMAFGENIESALIASGFEVHFTKDFTGDAALTVGPPGLHLVLKDPTEPNPLAVAIQKSFMSAGLRIPGLKSGDSDFSADKIQISIGQR